MGLLLLGLMLPLVVGVFAGSLEIPRNDDWTYRRIALDLASTGTFALEGASRPMIVGQILFTQPFLWLSGLQPWAFTIVGILFAAGAVVSAYALARELLPPRLAIVPSLLLVIFPGYLAYATSYMSDVPALVASFVCLALGARALKQRPVPTPWLVAAVAVGFFAFSIRDFAVAAPASVVLAAICAEPRRLRHWAIGLALAGCCAGLYFWEATLPGQFGDALTYANGAGRIILTVSSGALVIAPAAIIAAARWHRHWRPFDVIVGAEIGLLFVVLRSIQWVTGGKMPAILLDNLMSQWGAPAPNVLVGGRPLLFPDPTWVVINVLTLVAIVITFAVAAGIAGAHLRRCKSSSLSACVERLGSPQGVLVVFIASTAVGIGLFGLRYSLFDRYLWAILPPLATLMLYVPADLQVRSAIPERDGWRLGMSICAAIAGAALATIAVIYLLNSHAFDVARWRAGEALVRLGIPAYQIDAGYEWMGYHATTVARVATDASETYRDLWPSFRLCGVVSSEVESPDGAILVGTTRYELNLMVGPTETLYLYRLTTPQCAPAGN